MNDEKRLRTLRTLDEQIAEAIRTAQESGEIARARDYGKPLDFGDGYDETPPELRMAFKVLKDAGDAPPEVALMQELAALRKAAANLDPDSDEAQAAKRKIHDLELKVSMAVERLAKR